MIKADLSDSSLIVPCPTRSILPFRNTVPLRRSWRSKLRNYSTTFQMVIKLMAHVLASSVRTKKLYFLAELILCFILEFFELFKGLRLMFHQVDISIPTQIISEGNEVLITTPGCRAHWSTYITMH